MPNSPPEPTSTARVQIVRFEAARAESREDLVAREEPLQIQIGAAPLAIVMRTPGCDEALALGLLVSEGVIRSAADVAAVEHCREIAEPETEDNVIRVVLAPHVAFDLDALRRNLYSSSSCGICGRASIESVVAAVPELDDEARFEPAFFHALPERLSRAQPAFARTGGLHAAGLFAPDGDLVVAREDVGRHNAVDKVVGWALQRGRLPLRGHVLLVSGRISFEIAQKAAGARIPVIAALSAPSSLAIELAQAARITLVAFLRGRDFNVYASGDRVVG